MYKNAIYWFVLLLIIQVAGFWRSYFSRMTSDDVTFAQHFHAIAMLIWVLLLISQAWLINHRHNRYHRMLGMSSLFLAPIIVISGFTVIADISSKIPLPMPDWVPAMVWFGFFQLTVFALLYGLAIMYRKTMQLHMRYMCCTGVMFLNPGLSRLLDWLAEATPLWLPSGIQHFYIPILICVVMLIDDRRRGKFYLPWALCGFAWIINIVIFSNANQITALVDVSHWLINATQQ